MGYLERARSTSEIQIGKQQQQLANKLFNRICD